MSLKAWCFAVKQQFYGHFLATRIFHLATGKKFQSPLGAHMKKLISDPDVAQCLWLVKHKLHHCSQIAAQGKGDEHFLNVNIRCRL